jgi:hypothetical protein
VIVNSALLPEHRRGMATKCHNCDKPAMYLVGPEGNEFPLCLDCNVKHAQMSAIQSDQLERDMNFAASEMEAVSGLSHGSLPRYPQRQVRIIQGGPMTLNNITVKDSSVGVLNTGNLEIVDSAITALKANPQTQDVAGAILKLASAIADSELPAEKKNEAIEILSTVATEATAPEGKRKSSVVKRLLAGFPTLIQTSASAIEIWKTVEPIMRAMFP